MFITSSAEGLDTKQEERKISFRPCLKDEFYFGEDEESQKNEDKDWYLLNLRTDKPDIGAFISRSLSNLQCFDEEIELDTEEKSVEKIKLRVMFESCHPSWYTLGSCKSRNEINTWIRDKSIVTITNEENFLQEVYDDNAIKPSSRIRTF